MGFFDKVKNKDKAEKQNGTRNKIDDRELKISVANLAIQLLMEVEPYNSLSGLTVEFGYLFEMDERGIEALFKMTTDKGVYYFAVQTGSLMLIGINEEIFKEVSEKFLEIHGKT